MGFRPGLTKHESILELPAVRRLGTKREPWCTESMRTNGEPHPDARSSADSPQPPPSPRTSWNRRRCRSLVGDGDSNVQAAGTHEPVQPLRVVHRPTRSPQFARPEPDPSSPTSVATPFPGLRANSSQSAPWMPPGLKPLPYAALHQWVHEHDEVASVSEVPPTRRVCMCTPSDSLRAQFPDDAQRSASPTEDACEDGDWPEQTPTPLCISRK